MKKILVFVCLFALIPPLSAIAGDLQVNGQIYAEALTIEDGADLALFRLQGAGNGTDAASIQLVDSTDNKFWIIQRRDNVYSSSDDLLFQFNDGTNTYPAMNIMSDGDVEFHGSVGIGTDIPWYDLEIEKTDEHTSIGIINTESTNANRFPKLAIVNYLGDMGGASQVIMAGYGGKQGSIQPTPAWRNLGILDFYGHDGATVVNAGRIKVNTIGSPLDGLSSPTAYPAEMSFSVGSDGTCCGLTRMTIRGDTGNVGIGTTTPAEKLDVAGNAVVSGNIQAGGNVGIGTTTTPTEKLEVEGNAIVSGNAAVDGNLTVNGPITTVDGRILLNTRPPGESLGPCDALNAGTIAYQQETDPDNILAKIGTFYGCVADGMFIPFVSNGYKWKPLMMP